MRHLRKESIGGTAEVAPTAAAGFRPADALRRAGFSGFVFATTADLEHTVAERRRIPVLATGGSE